MRMCTRWVRLWLGAGRGGFGLHNEEDWVFSPCPLPAPGSGRTLAVARVGATLIQGHLGPSGRLEDGGAEKKEGLYRAGAELPGGGGGGGKDMALGQWLGWPGKLADCTRCLFSRGRTWFRSPSFL